MGGALAGARSSACEMFFNRELSWLWFNTRVLDQARDTNLPLLERLKFVSIYSSNLDEFYMIRVAGLKRLFSNGLVKVGPDKLTPLQQLSKIQDYIRSEYRTVQGLYAEIRASLQKENVFICTFNDLNWSQRQRTKSYFNDYLYPVMVPVAVDSTHPFPRMNNLSFAIAIKLKNKESDKIKYGIIRIPRTLSRFVSIDEHVYVLLESVVGEFAGELFEGYHSMSYAPFRVTRNADIEIEEDEEDDFITTMSEGLRARRNGEIVRLEIGFASVREEYGDLRDFINNHIKVSGEDIYEFDMPLACSNFQELVCVNELAHLRADSYNPKMLPLLEDRTNIFECVDSGDIVLLHPYESFDPVAKFIEQAAKDPNVLSIRMTLYRTGKNSPIIKALTEAAENNKQVTVFVELKARFDEENNLHWARSLESAGAHVIYGIPGLKVHAKMALVIRKVNGKLKKYMHLSTGNYNVVTAKIYTDVSLFTSNSAFANDVIKLFHSLSSGSSRTVKLDTLCVAPTQLKGKLLSLIENEIRCGNKGEIILKANACVDVDIINALYRASSAGVKINLIIRGICCLKPGMVGFSKNIRVFSIVGKYLEHSRIFFFKNDREKVYFSSADLMPRNLDRRVELLVPVLNKQVANKLLMILKNQLHDTSQIYELQPDGKYEKPHASDSSKLSTQEFYEKYITDMYNRHRQKNSKPRP